jgi:two-component system, NarL family, response regulator NreC
MRENPIGRLWQGRYVRTGMPSDSTSGPGNIRIVLADDHVVIRSGLRILLDREAGFQVVAEVGSSAEAERYVTTHHPDVVVLDLNMPDESGLDLIPRLRRAAPETQIVVLTMQRELAFARQALQSGALGYVVKDAADTELIDAVRAAATGKPYLNPQLGAKLAAMPPGGLPGDLTARELEILRLIALGHTNPEIASMLFLSIRTIEAHRSHIQQKLRVSARADLVRFALEHRLIDIPSRDD